MSFKPKRTYQSASDTALPPGMEDCTEAVALEVIEWRPELRAMLSTLGGYTGLLLICWRSLPLVDAFTAIQNTTTANDTTFLILTRRIQAAQELLQSFLKRMDQRTMEEALLVETIQSEIDACEKGVEQYKAAPAGPRKSQAILKSFLDRVEWSKTFLELILFMLLEARPLPAPINAKTVQSSFTSTLTVIREVYEPKPIRPIRHLVDSAEPAAEPKDALANETDTQTFFSARWQQFLSAIKTTVQGPYLEIVCQHVKQVPAALQLSGAASSVPAFHDIQKILSDFFADGSRKVFGLKAVVACINEYSALKNLEIRIEFRIELAQLLLDCLRPWGTDEHEIVGETAKAIEKLLTSLKALRTSLTYGGNGEQEFEKISAEFESAWDLEIRTKIFTKMIITKYTDKTTDEELHASRSELPQDSGGLKISSSAASILHLVKGSKIFKKITGK